MSLRERGSRGRDEAARSRLALYYQPIFELASGRMFGAEALLRWTPAAGDPVLPPEESGLVSSAGRWVLERACRQASAWRRGYPGLPLVVFVNLSEAQLQSAGLPAAVGRALRRSGLEPGGLGLEVTETAATAPDGRTVSSLGALRDTGVGVAIDDFGTGRSSLSRLRSLPADYLKLDKTFVDGLDSGSPRDESLVSAVIDLAHAFDTRVVAEGVESSGQRGKLREMGCDLAQGYHLSVPLSAEEASALVARSAFPAETGG